MLIKELVYYIHSVKNIIVLTFIVHFSLKEPKFKEKIFYINY